jgi:hypothetical protein
MNCRANHQLSQPAKQDVRLVAIVHPMQKLQLADDAHQLDRCR